MAHFESALEAVFEMQYPRYEQAEATSVAADLHSAGEYGVVTHNLLRSYFGPGTTSAPCGAWGTRSAASAASMACAVPSAAIPT